MPGPNNDTTNEMMDAFIAQTERTPANNGGQASADNDTDGNTSGAATDSGADADTSGQTPANGAAGNASDPRRAGQQRDANARPGDKKAPAQGQRLAADGRGNLVDEAGRIVAQAGANRRAYERLQSQYNTTMQEVSTLRGEVESYRRVHASLLQGGMKPADLQSGVEFLRQFRADPVGTIKSLVTEARAKGYNVELDGSTIDPSAIKGMIDEGLRPVREAAETQRAQRMAAERAEQEVGALFTEFPQARNQQAALTRMHSMKRYENYTLREKFLALQALAVQSGFDMSRDVLAQIDERVRGARASGAAQQQNGNNNRPAAGGGIPTGVGTTTARRVDTRKASAPPGTPVEDRVAAALAENGIHVAR